MFGVRLEQAADHAAIRRAHERAFFPRVQVARLVEGLRAEGALVAELSLVALRGDDVVAHVCFSGGLDSGVAILVLGPMGVAPSTNAVEQALR